MQGIGRKSQSKDIGGCTYAVTQLGGVDARNALLRLTKALGPSLGALADSSLASVFEKLALTEEDLGYFCTLFGRNTFVTLPDGKRPRIDHVFDDHFAGRMGAMIGWLAFAVEVNFSDFFDEARTQFGAALRERGAAPKGSSRSPSPSISTGSSGDSSPTSDSASPSVS